ncbi:hypothetical protein KL936_002422 [Ogataea polymorpha]|uniref:D-xylose 1-dehydrogenase (NADP(+), D-xylono-1,5-lactone-forming) n=1 Tax=Ogataea polymorpha TaxID=460523 RepID=A0A9P8PQP8_9ASCO|nr:hypothetical protein KL936_002422 [Ogataea polymorpha]KAH3676553.1 hypothetical protein OGATHE_001042 [Ogataea polymorpha]
MTDKSSKIHLRWGIVGLGQFAAKWANDVFSNYRKDSVHGQHVTHELRAVVSTSSLSKAQQFVSLLNGTDKQPVLYDSYQKFLEDDEIDIVYIAAPNAFHYKLAKQALEAGKHILVEKTFTINYQQALRLQEISARKNLLVVHGVWTRFLPTTKKLVEVVENGKVGNVRRVHADLSHNCSYDSNSRLFNPELGAGVLLDNLIYSITWTDLLLLSKTATSPKIYSWSIKSKEVPEIDVSTSITLLFDDSLASGTATGSFLIESPRESVLIEGDKGYIKAGRTSRPSYATFISSDGQEEQLELPVIEGIGYYYEANAAAIAIGYKQNDLTEYPLKDTIRILQIFDQCRLDNGIAFPESVEDL